MNLIIKWIICRKMYYVIGENIELDMYCIMDDVVIFSYLFKFLELVI